MIGLESFQVVRCQGEADCLGMTFLETLKKIAREMEKDFEGVFRDIETKAPKELVREYGTPEGSKVREFVPFVHGYQMTIGPDGKPKVKEFGNVHGIGSSSKREHLVLIDL